MLTALMNYLSAVSGMPLNSLTKRGITFYLYIPMDIRNNLSTGNHFSPYSANAYGSAPSGDGGVVHTPTAPPSFPRGGDSLMISTTSSYNSERKRERRIYTPDELRLRWQTISRVCGGFAGACAICFVLLVVQPLLVVLFTLGGCVSGGCDDWMEFAHEVFFMSLVPLSLMLTAGIISCLAYLRKLQIKGQRT